MNHHRFTAALTENSRFQTAVPTLSGFRANPLGHAVTPAQALLYQTAYQLAIEDVSEPEFPWAESWN